MRMPVWTRSIVSSLVLPAMMYHGITAKKRDGTEIGRFAIDQLPGSPKGVAGPPTHSIVAGSDGSIP
jgi:hypothetical protein